MTADDSPSTGRWDHVARQLQEWRRAADEPSYAEIALRISRRREAEGFEPAAARVGRTTVYDAFRLGRSRVNRRLVREIAVALDVEAAAVEDLLDAPAPVVSERPESVARPALVEQEPVEPTPVAVPRPRGMRGAVLLMLTCVALNLLGRQFVDLLGVPIYLDMVGTALAAVVLGPWRGAAVGATTNLLGVVVSGAVSLPFAVVNVVGALVWGYGVHRFGMGRTPARFFGLAVVVALACSVTAVPILHFLYEGAAGHQHVQLMENILALSHRYAVALWGGNLIASVADKLISAFVALVGATLLGHSVAGVVVTPRDASTRPGWPMREAHDVVAEPLTP
ncbi:ECF transporter S component [Nocardioides sp. Y6]|uniref:ECF transporter S component n=1 Tax=Nocardioides malaquae TaxID=2773426 RepID=A0ABR9RNW3_9ACTN|nr:ECF transporter S component [Nocardioides malaquae]MBE7323256.1 ECF transporter S component [Nocardioides malaquae]